MALPTRSEVGRGRISYVHYPASYESAIPADSVSASVDVSCAKARVGDVVEVSAEEETEIFDICGYVSQDGTITVKLINPGAEISSGPSFSLDIIVFHRN